MYRDPVEVFEAAARALEKDDWLGAAGLCDPATLSIFHAEAVGHFRPLPPRAESTVEDYLRQDPDMPPAVAEYFITRSRRMPERASAIDGALPGLQSWEALKAAQPLDVFAAWLEGRSPRHHRGRWFAYAGDRPPPDRWWPRWPKLRAIGAVHECDRTAHVLFRFAPPPEDEPQAMPHMFIAPEGEKWNGQRTATAESDAEPIQRAGRIGEIGEPAPAGDPSLDRQRPTAEARPSPADDEPGTRYTLAEQRLREEIGDLPFVTTCLRQPEGGWLLVAGWDFLALGQVVFGSGFSAG